MITLSNRRFKGTRVSASKLLQDSLVGLYPNEATEVILSVCPAFQDKVGISGASVTEELKYLQEAPRRVLSLWWKGLTPRQQNFVKMMLNSQGALVANLSIVPPSDTERWERAVQEAREDIKRTGHLVKAFGKTGETREACNILLGLLDLVVRLGLRLSGVEDDEWFQWFQWNPLFQGERDVWEEEDE